MFYRYPHNTNHIEGGTYDIDKLLVKNGLLIAVIFNFNTLTDDEVVLGVIKYRPKRTGNENHLHPYQIHTSHVCMMSPYIHVKFILHARLATNGMDY